MTTQYRVTMNCCTSGQCFKCLHLPYGQRVRHVHGEYTLDHARRVMRGWRAYEPEMEPITNTEDKP